MEYNFARDAHCDITMGKPNDVTMDIHCDITMISDVNVAMYTYYGIGYPILDYNDIGYHIW